MVTRRSLLAMPAAAFQAAPESKLPEVRFLCFAPSPYTERHDALRAGLGIFLCLTGLKLPLRATFYDGIPVMENSAKGRALLRGPRVLVLGSSTWAQGSAYYIRRYFEMVDIEDLSGVSATAWATAGGSHTGGSRVIEDTLRTLMGMGAQVFTLGQKYMVFQTGERVGVPEGDFTLLDCWYMDHFARTIAVVALAGADPAKAQALSKQLGVIPQYWDLMPKQESGLHGYRKLSERLNAAAKPDSEAWRSLLKLVNPIH